MDDASCIESRFYLFPLKINGLPLKTIDVFKDKCRYLSTKTNALSLKTIRLPLKTINLYLKTKNDICRFRQFICL